MISYDQPITGNILVCSLAYRSQDICLHLIDYHTQVSKSDPVTQLHVLPVLYIFDI
jgi:hypothetical protein